MNSVLSNSLYKKNNAQFQLLRNKTKEFNGVFNGNNIIRDDIFRIMENYARKQETKLEIMFLPIKDDDFCAFTCIRKGIFFVVINSWLPLSKQIFAAGHELYHIWCYFSNGDNSLLKDGSLLTADDMNEDMEANAFAALLLVPLGALNEQMDIYGIDKKNITLKDVLLLMSIFAIPYKALILRLYEEGYLSEKITEEFLTISSEEVLKSSELYGDGVRWQRRTPEIVSLGHLQGLINSNDEMEVLSQQRIQEDRERLSQIMQIFGKE